MSDYLSLEYEGELYEIYIMKSDNGHYALAIELRDILGTMSVGINGWSSKKVRITIEEIPQA